MGKNTNDRETLKKRVRGSIAALCIASAAVAGVGIGTSFTTCYTVEYRGIPVAYVDSKAELDSALLQAEAMVSDLLQTDYSFGQEIQVKTDIVPRNSVSELPEATDSIMEQIPELTRLYTLTVDGVYIGAADKAETITRALDRVKDFYRTPETVSVSIESQIDLAHRFLPEGSEIMDEDALVEALMAQTVFTFAYTTQEGDTLEDIALRFGMDPQRLDELNAGVELEIAATDTDVATLDEILGDTELTAPGDAEAEQEAYQEEIEVTREDDAFTDDVLPEDMDEIDPEILAANAVRQAYAALDAAALTENGEELDLTRAPLNPGQLLTVEQTCSRLVISTVEETVTDREVMPERFTLLDSSIPVGTQEVLVEGTPGQETVLIRVTKRCGVPVASADLNSVTRLRAEPLLVAVGYGSHPELFDFFGVDGLMFQWPVQGNISSDYGYRYIFGGLNFHRGVDIPAPMGSAVHAAANGTVIFAGSRGSYGNLVIIDHGNGFQTLYGHNSGFVVKEGDVVTKGQTIAAVGSTGRSTGPHCHFEVHLNGVLVDPLMYLPGENNAPARMQIPLSELNQGEEETEQTSAETTAPAPQTAEPEPEKEMWTEKQETQIPEKQTIDVQTPWPDEPVVPEESPAPAQEETPAPAQEETPAPAQEETPAAEPSVPDAAEAPAEEIPAEQPAPLPEE